MAAHSNSRCRAVIWARHTSVLLLLAVGIARSSTPAEIVADSSIVHNFHIDSQPLGDALQEFARQGDVQVVFFSRLVDGKTAPPVRGRFTLTAALELLLENSGMTYAVVDSTTFEIRARDPD